MTQWTMPMLNPAHLIFENGVNFSGYSFGASNWSSGEVVFNTSMTGYQEMLTDPSYAGQIVVATYPLMGNYGINDTDFESQSIQVAGLIVRELRRVFFVLDVVFVVTILVDLINLWERRCHN